MSDLFWLADEGIDDESDEQLPSVAVGGTKEAETP